MFSKNHKINFFLSFVFILLLIGSGLLVSFNKEIKQEQKKAVDSSVANDFSTDIETLQELNKDVVLEANRIVLGNLRSIDASDHVLGAEEAPVEMIVYCDLKNNLCADFSKTIDQVKQEFGDKVQLAFRHFYNKSSGYSEEAALAVECAGEQGEFWKMYDELLHNYINSVASSQYLEIAAKIGLDVEVFEECVAADRFLEKIEEQIQEADSFGILGTPSSFINGEKIPGSYAFEDFSDSVGRSREGVKNIILRNLN